MSSTCPHNMVNFGLLTAEIHPIVWGTPANFNRGRHLYSAGRPSRWALAHILVFLVFALSLLAKRLAGKCVSEMTYFCQIGCKTLTQLTCMHICNVLNLSVPQRAWNVEYFLFVRLWPRNVNISPKCSVFRATMKKTTAFLRFFLLFPSVSDLLTSFTYVAPQRSVLMWLKDSV